MRRRLLFVILTGALACTPGGDGDVDTRGFDRPQAGPDNDSRWTVDDVEVQLASIENGKPVALDNPSIETYSHALNRAAGKCHQDRRTVADMSVRAWQLAQEAGHDSSILEMLQTADEAVPPEMAPTDCREIFAAAVTIMDNG